MVVDFSHIDLHENPVLILKNANDATLGVLGYAYGCNLDLNFNEVSAIEFAVPSMADGQEVPLYDKLISTRIIEIPDVGQFTLINPIENNNGATRIKKCTGYSLEYEFSYKKLTLPEDTYKFWDEDNPGDTMLGIIMELMPSWHVGDVPSIVANKYRTFSITNENLYNIMKNTLQVSYNCIFDFDTLTRTVNVLSVSEEVNTQPVYVSVHNLAKSIELTEKTEDIVTRLDVNGADGVTIRDVNPTGTNKIINLDYYMTTDNFSQELINKYNAWSALVSSKKDEYYTLSVQYVLKQMQRATEAAKLTDMRGERTSLENVRAVTIQGIAQNISGVTQSTLDDVNDQIDDKEEEIADQQALIGDLDDDLADIYAELQAIVAQCRFESYFTAAEYKILDRYIKDGDVSESSFVVAENNAYIGEDKTATLANGFSLGLSGGDVTEIETENNETIYEIKGGELVLTGSFTAKVISAIGTVSSDNSIVFTAYLSAGAIGQESFQSGSLSLTGSGATAALGDILAFTATSGYRYFTSDVSEYDKRSVAFELYDYGEEVLNKLSKPTYTFSVTAANFLAAAEFIAFKNAFKLGRKLYVEIKEGSTLSPIAIGARFSYGDYNTLQLKFGDSYVAEDSTFKLADLLEQSISSGKDVEVNKYTYGSFVDSGASTEVRTFMTSDLDVAKNAILSTEEQAVSWDATGIRLRKWANNAHTGYDGEQIWISNNSIMMTDDGWQTAAMAIGKFYDPEFGVVWGLAAPMVVGKMLVGQQLVIESTKQYLDGGVTHVAFRVDSNGASLYNGDFIVSNDDTQVVITPELGLIIGVKPVYSVAQDGTYSIESNNATFWADTDGNIHMAGYVYASGGYLGGTYGWTIEDGFIYSGTATTLGAPGGIYLGTDGISVGSAVIMKNDGTFILRRNNIDNADDYYTLKVAPEEQEDGSTQYKLYVGDITLEDSFIMPERFGGTGTSHFGLHRANSVLEMYALSAQNGDICIVFANGLATVSGAMTTTPVSTSPGWIEPANILNPPPPGHGGKVFGIAGPSVWNMYHYNSSGSQFGGPGVLIGSYCTGKVSGTDSYTKSPVYGLVVPMTITVTQADVSTPAASSLIVHYANRLDAMNAWDRERQVGHVYYQKLYIRLFRSDGTLIAQDTRSTKVSNFTGGEPVGTASWTLKTAVGALTSGEYYLVLYADYPHCVGINTVTVETDSSSVSAEYGVYYMSADAWEKL